VISPLSQAWYYVNIYRLADGEGAASVKDLGCMSAYMQNEKVEGDIASSLKGIDCHGSHHRPNLATTLLMLDGLADLLQLKLPLLVISILLAVYMALFFC
jgi:hypothetical protein